MRTPEAPPRETPPATGVQGGFRLLRHFTLATLLAFAVVALVLVIMQRGEEEFFAQVQRQQRAFFAQAQATLARQHEAAAMASLLAVHEASHVNLTRLVANMMWASDIAPFVARAQAVSSAACPEPAGGAALPPDARRACGVERGRKILALPGFASLDQKAYAAMHASTVFKMKVFDLRGVTVYSSEHGQIGDLAAGNAGWRGAVAGRPTSELTHRDRFSAFEGVVENRDLISTYVPVRDEPGGAVVGVVELYSDVTPFLAQIKDASTRFAEITAANEAAVGGRSDQYQRAVSASSNRFLMIVIGLLAALYTVSLLIVRRGQRLLDRQALEQARAAQREQARHREKMAALATMAAGVAHEVGNPLAVIAGLAQELPSSDGQSEVATQILQQTARIMSMMRQISDFASARGGEPEAVDLNRLLKALCDFHAFDRRFKALPIEFVPGQGLPAAQLSPDHLNEMMMDLLQALAETAPTTATPLPVRVASAADGDGVCIEIASSALDLRVAEHPRMQAVRRRVKAMSGRIEVAAGRIRIALPAAPDAAG